MKSLHNKDISRLLRQIAAAYLIKGGNRFKIIAYERAADAIEQSIVDIHQLWKEKRLADLPGVGKTIAIHLDELFRTGAVKHFEEVLSGVSSAIFPLLDVPGIGPKRAYTLVEQLHLSDPATVVADLLQAAHSGQIAAIPGFGDKSQEDIIEAIARYRKGQVKEQRMPLPYASAVAQEVVAYIKQHPRVVDAVPLGSLRRGVSTIGDIDIGVATAHPLEVISWFVAYPHAKKVIEQGPAGATILLANGREIDLRVQEPQRFGAMLQHFTGNKNHNVRLRELALKKGLSLSEAGIKKVGEQEAAAYATEESFYAAIGVPWMPPELREDRGEIQAAVSHTLPQLVSIHDIRGDFHIHTNYDLETSHDTGTSSIEDLVARAGQLGYSYIGLSDHNPGISSHTAQEVVSIMKKRCIHFEQLMSSIKSTRVHIFTMLEVDIQPDGGLALPDEAFAYVDAVIVSVHSTFSLDRTAMTKRVIRGLSHPAAKILGHPTGRLIGKREGFELDWPEIFSFCITHNKALEINSSPSRLDLPDSLVYQAVQAGVKLVINTDSHDVSHMPFMPYGVQVARRGWASKDAILNTMPYNRVKSWLQSRT